MGFPHFSQLEYSDCGATCLKIVLKYYRKSASLDYLRKLCATTRSGTSLKELVAAAEVLEFETCTVLCTTEWLSQNQHLPCILHWRNDHFVVLYKIHKEFFYISDPAFGKIKLNRQNFDSWWKDGTGEGIALLLEPNSNFASIRPENTSLKVLIKRSFGYYKSTITEQKSTLIMLFLSVAASTGIVFFFPRTMQTIVDSGVMRKDIGVLWSMFAFQMSLIIGQSMLVWLQGWLRVNFSMSISIKMITQLLYKVIRLPVMFFDTKVPTDIFQRIEDQRKIESFLSEHLVQTFFSIVITIVLTAQLFVFNVKLGSIFTSLSIISLGWVTLFYRYRRQLDYTNFRLTSENHNMMNELLTGMVEIKVNNSQDKKIAQWRTIQDKLFSMRKKTLRLGVYQNFGVQLLTQFKNIIITLISAYWVVKGDLTLGAMLSIGYILGVLGSPIESLANFFQTMQDVHLSLNRLDEIMSRPNEVRNHHIGVRENHNLSIYLKDVSFSYSGKSGHEVLKRITINIKSGKTTAIVGTSGSGKTTLIKLLLNFYEPTSGSILLDEVPFTNLDPEKWRGKCGIVLQDGFLFSGTIADNIAIGEDMPSFEKLLEAAKIACIDEFIMKLPLKFNTKVGNVGVGLSGGQKQRILIARAVYRNPEILFLDEATSALDSNNEQLIMANLQKFISGKTVVIIAHRLSTVKNADQIIVLEDGELKEVGNHDMLSRKKGKYFELVKNQLELGT